MNPERALLHLTSPQLPNCQLVTVRLTMRRTTLSSVSVDE
jgi:hypothetical protein